MRLLKLTPSQRDPNRYGAEFEDGERLAVTVALIADYSLFTGCELDDEAYAALKVDASRMKIRERALRILGSRNMSRREMIDRLGEKGEDPAAAEETADWLISLGALNDGEYAAMIVRHYASKGYGAMRIRGELYRRGIEKELWEEALDVLPDMEASAYDALKAKLRGSTPDRKELKRALDALLRRGFSWEEVRAAKTRYFTEIGENTDEE